MSVTSAAVLPIVIGEARGEDGTIEVYVSNGPETGTDEVKPTTCP